MTTNPTDLAHLVAPLVWVKHPSRDIWRCDMDAGTYKVFGIGPVVSWDFDSGNSHISHVVDDVEFAKSRAQADHAARVLAACPALVDLVRDLEAALVAIDARVCWEINPRNYDHTDVCDLNDGWKEVGNLASAALAKIGGDK